MFPGMRSYDPEIEKSLVLILTFRSSESVSMESFKFVSARPVTS